MGNVCKKPIVRSGRRQVDASRAAPSDDCRSRVLTTTDSAGLSPLLDLPNEILRLVLFELLPGDALTRLSSTCRALRELCRSEDLWRHVCRRDFPLAGAPDEGTTYRDLYVLAAASQPLPTAVSTARLRTRYRSATVAPDGRIALVESDRCAVTFHDLSGRPVSEVRLNREVAWAWVTGLVIDADRRVMLEVPDGVQIFDELGRFERQIDPIDRSELRRDGSAVLDMSFVGCDGQLHALTSKHMLTYDIRTGARIGGAKPRRLLTSVAFGRSGAKVVCSARGGGFIYVYDSDGVSVGEFRPEPAPASLRRRLPRFVALSPGGRLYVAYDRHPTVCVFAVDGTPLGHFDTGMRVRDGYLRLGFTPDGALVAFACWSQEFKVFRFGRLASRSRSKQSKAR